MKMILMLGLVIILGLISSQPRSLAANGPSQLFSIPSGLPVLSDPRSISVDSAENMYVALQIVGQQVQFTPSVGEIRL